MGHVILKAGGSSDLDFITATADKILSPYIGSDVEGEPITGTIPTKSASSLSASGKTVTVPSGYYPSQVTKDVSTGSATGAGSGAQSTPSISVSSSGLITASVAAKTISCTPTVSAGYVSSGTAGNVSLTASSNTKQLTTNAGGTVTLNSSTTQKQVSSGNYLTAALTVKVTVYSGG